MTGIEIFIYGCIAFLLISVGAMIGFILSSRYWKEYYNDNNFYN